MMLAPYPWQGGSRWTAYVPKEIVKRALIARKRVRGVFHVLVFRAPSWLLWLRDGALVIYFCLSHGGVRLPWVSLNLCVAWM